MQVNTDECWFWAGRVDKDGYGRIYTNWFDNKFFDASAYRLMYEVFVGPIPTGLALDHLCKNRICVNPDHLEPVTLAENNRRKNGITEVDGISICQRGHELTPDNLYLWVKDKKTGRMGRQCRACVLQRKREIYHKEKEE